MSAVLQQLPAVEQPQAQRSTAVATRAGFFDLDSFELMQRVSKAFASSDLVPQAYRGNLANCMIALDMAQRIGANPLMTMQNLYVVHGTPGWSSKFLIATINASGRFSSLRYEWRGEPGQPEFGCRAWAIERATNERLDGIWVTWKMVKAEGWDSKSGSKWKTMPDQMFVYRAAAFWQRAYAPELAMGLQTVEDLHDVIDVTPTTITEPAKPTRVHIPTPGRSVPAAAEEAAPPAEVVDQQTGEIKPQRQLPNLTDLIADIDHAPDRAAAELVLREGENLLIGDEFGQLRKAFDMAWGDQKAPAEQAQHVPDRKPSETRRPRSSAPME